MRQADEIVLLYSECASFLIHAEEQEMKNVW
jgi:hypothetical protein